MGIKVDNIMVSHITYNNYIKENNSERLDKFLKIYTYKKFRESVFESFDKLYPNTKFSISKYVFGDKFSNYNNGHGYQIFFKTDSDTEYRVDLIPMINYNMKIDSEFIWSISFTLKDNSIYDESYEELTKLDETREVLLRIGDILNRIDIPKYYIIGDTTLKSKIKLYKNFLLLVFPDYNIEMLYCDGFINDKGLYIW